MRRVQDGRDAKQALTGASKDMAAVHAEKAALLSQWQSALQAVRKRDEALKVSSTPCSLLLNSLRSQVLVISAEVRPARNGRYILSRTCGQGGPAQPVAELQAVRKRDGALNQAA